MFLCKQDSMSISSLKLSLRRNISENGEGSSQSRLRGSVLITWREKHFLMIKCRKCGLKEGNQWNMIFACVDQSVKKIDTFTHTGLGFSKY